MSSFISDLIADLVPASFATLAFAHFLALISPGPDFFLIIGHAVRRRLRGTAFICIGIALGNAIYIVVAVAGWSAIKHSPLLYRCVELAGAAYLVWMGVMLIRSGRKPAALSISEFAPLSWGRQLLVGLASALLNPKNAVFYLTLMTVILGPEATLVQLAFAGSWMVFLVLFWDLAIAAIIAHPGVQVKLARKIPLVEITAGIFLILIALWLVFMSV